MESRRAGIRFSVFSAVKYLHLKLCGEFVVRAACAAALLQNNQ
jgi:hypothetical protein